MTSVRPVESIDAGTGIPSRPGFGGPVTGVDAGGEVAEGPDVPDVDVGVETAEPDVVVEELGAD